MKVPRLQCRNAHVINYRRLRVASSAERLKIPVNAQYLQLCCANARSRLFHAREPRNSRCQTVQTASMLARCPNCSKRIVHLPRVAGRGLIAIYRYTLSPLIGFHCRHLPTCSAYADEALARHGLWAGGWMTLARLLRCQPFGTHGIDNVPARSDRMRWYLPWRYGRWSWRPLPER